MRGFKGQRLMWPVAALALFVVQAEAATIFVQQFMIPGNSTAVYTVTTSVQPNPFVLSHGQAITLTVPNDGMVIVTGTAPARWEPSVMITHTLPTGLISDTSTVTYTYTSQGLLLTGKRAIVTLDLSADQEITVSFTNTHESVPEPATATLWLTGLGVAWLARRRFARRCFARK